MKPNLFYLLIICLVSSLTIHAQNASISGTVTDDLTGEEIIGAGILIEGTTKGGVTDLSGKFEINNVVAGDYLLICSYLGFKSDTIQIKVSSGSAIKLEIKLKEDNQLLETVTITAVRKAATEVAVLSTMKESMQIISGVSAETIKKTLDSDASQVVKRIPGVTVIQDRFIVIRGLNERYNTTLLHNLNTPSMEPDVRSFSFDVIPSNIIDQVLIYKSPAPELPGDFSGGAVKIFTKSIPDENNMIIDIGTAYRQGSSLRSFNAEERRSGNWTGFNDGYNNLPVGFPENLNGLSDSEINQAGQSLPNNWGTRNYNSGLDYKVALTNNFRKAIGNRGMEIGNVTSVQYNNSKTVFDISNRAFEAYDFINNQSKLRFDFEDREYGQEIMVGLVHNWALRFNNNHVIEFKNLFNRLSTFDHIERFGEQVAQGFTQNSFAFFNEYRGLYSGQVVGTHKMLNESLRLEWIGGFGNSFNELPDYRRYRRNVVDKETGESVLFVPRGQTPDLLGKFYSNMNENIYSGAINLEYHLNHNKASGFKPIIKGGIYFELRDRMFEARDLGYSRGFNFDEPNLTALNAEDLFISENINVQNGIKLGENFTPNNFYQASNDLKAYYLSLNIPIGKNFNLFGGVRIEDNLQILRSPDRFKEGTSSPPFIPVELEQLSILPSVTLSYNINSKMVIKGVYGKTVNRPEFREIAPFGFYDFIFDATVTGYTFLQNASIDNFDLRWEYYPTPTETVSFAIFYKNFQNPIESLYGNFGSEQNTFLFRNTESAVARGVELDLRKSLNGLTNSKFLDRINLLTNISIIDSEVKIGAELTELLRVKDRPLQGQSNFIVNSGIFYDDRERGLQVNIIYNVIGKRILLVGAGAIADTYEMPRNVLDISISKSITERLVLRIGAKDIINQQFLLLQDGNEDGIFDRQSDQIFRSFRPGTTYSIGISYKIY